VKVPLTEDRTRHTGGNSGWTRIGNARSAWFVQASVRLISWVLAPCSRARSIAMLSIFDGELKVDVFLASEFATQGMDLFEKFLCFEFVSLLEVP
jgi:hypothetical protein